MILPTTFKHAYVERSSIQVLFQPPKVWRKQYSNGKKL